MSRWPGDPLDQPLGEAFWTGIVAALFAGLLLLSGCAKPAPTLSPVQVSALAAGVACRTYAIRAVARHDTCPPAQLDVDANQDCARAYPEGYDLDCPEFRRKP